MSDCPVLTYKGEKPQPSMLVDLWVNTERRFAGPDGRTDRIQKCEALRNGTARVKLDATFLKNHPEIDPETAVSQLPERETYERELIARAGAAKIEISREPLDVTDTAVDLAEEYEAYMREVAEDEEGGTPDETMFEKGTEDGEFGHVTLPAHLDADGIPDLYDRLTERALKALKADDRREYERDQHDRRGRFVRKNEDGSRRYSPKFERDAKGRTRKAAEQDDGRGSFKADRDRSKKEHEAAVRRYLLGHRASTQRVIPALDCFPLLGRGKGKQRWSVEGLIERVALEREDLVGKQLGWHMLGNRLVLPKGVSQRSAWASKNEYYLYIAYLMLYADDDPDGQTAHPCLLYTVGGAGTWWDGWDGTDEEKKDQVAIIDLWEEHRISAPVWGYQFGTHTSANDPKWYGRPAIWPFRRRILNLEGLETAAHVTTQVSAYTGHYYKPDAALLKEDPEAVIEASTHTLRRPKIPAPGEVQPWMGDVLPFAQSQIGADHYRMHDTYMLSLQQGMAVDDIRGDSGQAMLVSSTQGQISKRHIREAVLRAKKFMLETDARIRLGAFKLHGVKWPILTSKERPVGHEVRSRMQPVEFNPDWLGPDENVKLNVKFGEEVNLAKADQEMNAADRGYRSLKNVAAAFGESDVMNLRFEIAKDQMWKMPENQMLLQQMVDARRSMTRARKAAMLQMQQKMTKDGIPGIPGAEQGIPSAMLRPTSGGQGGGGGRPPAGASARGGITGAAKTADAAAFAAEQQLGAA